MGAGHRAPWIAAPHKVTVRCYSSEVRWGRSTPLILRGKHLCAARVYSPDQRSSCTDWFTCFTMFTPSLGHQSHL